MAQNSIDKAEQIIRESKRLEVHEREALLILTRKLRHEVSELKPDDKSDAESVAAITKVAAHEHLRLDRDYELLDISKQGLERSIRKFEAVNPEITAILQNISVTLSNLGI